ncbi:MAG: flagellin [Veillonellaceae bacterium]|nr:flagellin [Veillonellaceae bacterium]
MRPYQVTKVIIQDTDTAGMAVQIAIPRTTMDHILGVLPEKHSIEEFDVTKKEMREQLLGREKTYWSTLSREERLEYLKKTRVDDSSPDVAEDGWTGMLDHGVEYLLKSLSYVGSQINRLENSENNIATEIDTTTNVESTIRDADMAQTATEYAKFSVLTQSGQAMLAQANQNQSGVLSLLS